MRPFIQILKEQSSLFLTSMMDPPAIHLYGGTFSFQMNVISSTNAAVLGDTITADNALSITPNLLFDHFRLMPIEWGDTKNLALDKLLETLKASHEFSLRGGNSRFFPIFVSNADYEGQLSVADTLNALYAYKPSHLIHPFGLFFQQGSDNCNHFDYRRALTLSSLIRQSYGSLYELCHLYSDPSRIIEQITSDIYLEMSRNILTFKPRLSSIQVFLNGLSLKNSRWVYDPHSSEISLKQAASFANIGDQLDVVYEIEG